jgi:hypothetical protein
MKPYFVLTPQTAEYEAMKQAKPRKILVSYHYWKTKSLVVITQLLGYRPEIMLDSGAYSAFTTGRNISPIDFINYAVRNADYITHLIALDVIGRPDLTKIYYEIIKGEGLNPLPVYHYGSDLSYLDYYVKRGCEYIALGGSVPEPDKEKVASWVNSCSQLYPSVKFHLLGTNSKKVYENCPDLESLDASTWIMGAVNGYPKHISGKSRVDKIERAVWNLLHFEKEIVRGPTNEKQRRTTA